MENPHNPVIEYATGERTVISGSNPLERGFPRETVDEGVRILYPLDNDRFVFSDRPEDARIPLEAIASRPDSQLTWFIDGVEFERTAPPYRTDWRPEKGTHTLAVAGADGLAHSVRVVVE